MDELEAIRERYELRKSSRNVRAAASATRYNNYIAAEREKVYEQLITGRFSNPSTLKVLEIGAGNGSNLPFFHKLGIPWSSITANELLEDRVGSLKANFPGVAVYPGDALQLPFEAAFDIVFQSTVFTSILDTSFRTKLAAKMWQMTKPGGMVLWYDFIYNNPSNSDVKGVTVKEVRELFRDAGNMRFVFVTLAPPIGRRVGKLYPFFNAFPFLRTHVVAGIFK